MLYLDYFNVDDTECLIPGSEATSPERGNGRSGVDASDNSPGNTSSDDQRAYKDSPKECRRYKQKFQPFNALYFSNIFTHRSLTVLLINE